MEKEINQLKILHLSMCASTIFTILLFHFLIEPISFDNISSSIELLDWVGLVMSTLAMLASSYLFNKKVNELGGLKLTPENTVEMRANFILKWSLLNGSAMICTILYFFTNGNPILIITALLSLLMLFLSRPHFPNKQ